MTDYPETSMRNYHIIVHLSGLLFAFILPIRRHTVQHAGWHFTAGLLICVLSACSRAAPTITISTKATPSVISSEHTLSAATLSVKPASSPVSTRHCTPTLDDGVSPSYKPNMPVRSVVGHGHILTGSVLSSKDCQPIVHAQLEMWPEEGTQGHHDTSRAMLFTDEGGRYRFECDPPDHIHMRISAPGYRTIGVNSYHPNGQAAGTLDIVLMPEKP